MDCVKVQNDPSLSEGISAIDFVGLTTGELIDRLGSEYIHAGYWGGSYLFYFVDHPNIYFAFNSNSSGSVEIVGSETVVAAFLSGSAKVNDQLSANLNKEEIDAAILAMPDVQNVQERTYYIDLDNLGNAYEYKIETSRSYITFTWYLDLGGNINNAASEIVINAK